MPRERTARSAMQLVIAELLDQFRADLGEGMDWDTAVARLKSLYGRDLDELLEWATKAAARQPLQARFKAAFDRVLQGHIAAWLISARQPISDLPSPNSPRPPLLNSGRILNAGLAADFSFDRARFTDRMVVELRGVSAEALQDAGTELLRSLGRDDVFTMPPQKALDFLTTRENKLTGMANEVFDELRGQLDEGLRLGETLAEIAKRLEGKAGLLSRERAEVIATTETSAAYGAAQQEAMQQANASGRLRKRWVTSGLDNVRAEHRRVNGMTVGIDEPFKLHRADGSIEELMHPGDPDGSPENVINCHCIAVAVEEQDFA